MNALRDLHFFVRAARAASFAEAARAMDLTTAAASATMKRLEEELGVKLFVRSTRNLRLTAEGELFLVECEIGLETITNACENISAGLDKIRGKIQLSVPSDLGRNLVVNWLYLFRQQYPDVQVRLQLSDRLAGIYREQVDVALRYGEAPDSSMVALPVAPANRRVLCASPDYLKRNGTPASPEELKKHNCLCFMLNDRPHNYWKFNGMGQEINVNVSGSFVCDDGDAVHKLALLGEGIAFKSAIDVAADVRSGLLVTLCNDWQGELAPLYLLCANRGQLRPVVRLLREFLVERCRECAPP